VGVVMSVHRLSAGSGYQYLLRHTASGDVQRLAGATLTAYYAASGYPPGRWLGAGVAGLGQPTTCGPAPRIEAPTRVDPPATNTSSGEQPQPSDRLAADQQPDGNPVSGPGPVRGGDVVTEEQMARLYGQGLDPVTGDRLGARYRVHRPVEARVADRVARLPDDLSAAERAAAVADIERQERRKGTPSAVSGFDLTFTMAKSASVLWALAPPAVQARIAAAHRDTVSEVIGVLERDALFTRTGHDGVAQIGTRGAVAACFDHWDTRAGDPNLHTHVVLANKVQGADGRWRSVDSRALHHAAVALSELYDDLLADRLTRDLGVRWGWRWRGPRRTSAFEIDGVEDPLLGEFSTRSKRIEEATRGLVAEFQARFGHAPDRAEVLKIRQQATLATRPEKTLRPLPELIAGWRARAEARTPIRGLLARALRRTDGPQPVTCDTLSEDQLAGLAERTLAGLQDRRATWNRWNVRAEAARATRGLRMAATADRLALIDQITTRVLDGLCVALDPPALFEVPERWRRPDGTSAFTRTQETAHTSPAILDAETRLLAAASDTGGPRAHAATAVTAPVAPAAAGAGGGLHPDQVAAVAAVVGSGRPLDVLVGPSGAGKTRTLRAVRADWEAAHGPASVIGLAPSATAAAELSVAVGIACDTLAKWAHETSRTDTARLDDSPEAGVAWRLRPGQLVIVDEASLAGTLTLDRLATRAGQAGAKLLLVGDHHQLGAVDAGGAFGLLARDTGAAELSLLWRFRHRWEADASRGLRRGDTRALDTYTAHGRLHDGPAEAMVEAAYQAWREASATGQHAVMVAADNAMVAALNARAQTDLAGHLTPAGAADRGTGGVVLHDESRAGIGDRVLTRRNDRRLTTTAGSWVRNGNLWTVTATHADGSLDVKRPGRAGDTADTRDTARLPAGYVREHVELGYATTVHRAQGITADTAHVLVRPGMSREALYVALTRGRDANHAYVATDLPDPDHPHPQPGQPGRTCRQVLHCVLACTDAEVSATETLRDRYDTATSLATLVPIYQTIVQAADRDRCTGLLQRSDLDDAAVARVVHSPAYGALVAALRAAEHAGHDLPTMLGQATASRRDQAGDPAHDDGADAVVDPELDPAFVLHDRVTRWVEETEPIRDDSPLIAGLVPAAHHVTDPELKRTLRDIESLITTRTHALVTGLLHRPAAWAIPLGPPPRDSNARRGWLDALAVVAGYRDLHNITTTQPLGDSEDRKPDPGGERRRATSAAATAARLAHTRQATSTRSASHPSPERGFQR
jgi:conjugative relaxase-like TrwC/TraI family protein